MRELLDAGDDVVPLRRRPTGWGAGQASRLVVDQCGREDVGEVRPTCVPVAGRLRFQLARERLKEPVKGVVLYFCAGPVTMAGRPAAATTVARKRAVFYNALKYAVRERKLLEANPIDQVDWKAPEKTDQVDRSVVANPAQVRQLLAFVTYVGPLGGRGTRLRAMYACMYYGGLRPSEAAGLRRQDCELPDLCVVSVTALVSFPCRRGAG